MEPLPGGSLSQVLFPSLSVESSALEITTEGLQILGIFIRRQYRLSRATFMQSFVNGAPWRVDMDRVT